MVVRPVEINLLVFTVNLLENTDGVLITPPHQRFSRDGTLLPSIYADVRYIDDVITIEGLRSRRCVLGSELRRSLATIRCNTLLQHLAGIRVVLFLPSTAANRLPRQLHQHRTWA